MHLTGARLLLAAMRRTIDAVMVDLSGTIHIENQAICGAQEALERLKRAKVKVKFVTNTTKESLNRLHERLCSLGFDLSKDDIFTSLTAARRLVERRRLRPRLFLEEVALEDFQGIDCNDPNAVVVGLAPTKFNYADMNDAFRLVLNGASLIAINKARYYKTSTGLNLGAGPFVAALEYATDGTIAEIVGKPSESFFQEALRELGCQAQHTVMIGDDVRDDVKGAMDAGMMGILVKTGKYRPGDESKIDPAAPTLVCNDFPEAVDRILQLRQT
ncbi:haloacid dehalogenase-like hydrolase domain-containing protein 2 [Tubulanus polymorphus]|uniref:haloacid dehalogenase-like hydrolase domain-containing protein 2 n=1 Tax=Tubulanus polymorphus TaxID=672921 RepID=UPI003DA373C5